MNANSGSPTGRAGNVHFLEGNSPTTNHPQLIDVRYEPLSTTYGKFRWIISQPDFVELRFEPEKGRAVIFYKKVII